MTVVNLGEMDRERLESLFRRIDEELEARGARASIRIVGGAALISAAGRDRATTDIDYAPIEADRRTLDEIGEKIRGEERLAQNWLNWEGAGALPDKPDEHEKTVFEGRALTVAAPGPRRLLAMKLLAGGERNHTKDAGDAIHLAKQLKLTRREDLVAAFEAEYGDARGGARAKVEQFVDRLFKTPAMARYVEAVPGAGRKPNEEAPVRGAGAEIGGDGNWSG